MKIKPRRKPRESRSFPRTEVKHSEAVQHATRFMEMCRNIEVQKIGDLVGT
jgi:hypothetical protein